MNGVLVSSSEEKMLPALTLVLGGAASGKSVFAEKLIIESGLPRVYLATARVWDDEIAAKVEAHKRQRGPDWTTLEAPLDVESALQQVPSDHAILLDCATMWLTNQMVADADLETMSQSFVASLSRAPGPLVVVSNELGQGIVPENAMARAFREAQGRLNQRIAQQADLVVTVIAGLPLVLKGTLP